MRALLPAGLFLLSAVLGSGCLVVDKHARFVSPAPSCHPSQYWDGQQCRHKGKGKGARKHDGEGKGNKG
jgi:hypothetical protein